MTALADHSLLRCSPPPPVDLAEGEYRPIEGEVEPFAADPADELLVSDVPPAAPSGALVRRWTAGRRATLVSFAAAAALHAAAIAAGLHYAKPAISQPPQLVLPQGWATDFAGSSDAGARTAILQPAPPMDLPVPQAVAAQRPGGAPPGELEPITITPPPVAIDAAQGTADFGPLPALGADSAAPAVNFRTPPIAPGQSGKASGDAHESAADAPASAPATERHPSPSGGSASDGAGAGSGGGVQGVPDGMPVPSKRNRMPAYPEVARQNKWTGTVRLELEVDEKGRVTAVHVVGSSGYPVLDEAAAKAAEKWSFTPATLNGRPMPVTVPIPMNFTLNDRR